MVKSEFQKNKRLLKPYEGNIHGLNLIETSMTHIYIAIYPMSKPYHLSILSVRKVLTAGNVTRNVNPASVRSTILN